MARLRRKPRQAGLREELAARYRRLLETYAAFADHPGCPWRDRLARLEAGEPLELEWSALPVDHLPAGAGLQPPWSYRVESDGSLTAL